MTAAVGPRDGSDGETRLHVASWGLLHLPFGTSDRCPVNDCLLELHGRLNKP